jgi:prophage antirepressor-like protein
MPENKIIPFDYGDNLIRVVKDEETGEPLWIAKDVCTVLGLENVNRAVSKLDDDEKLKLKIFTSGQNRDTMFITESGLYNLIFRSNKPEAKPFKRWVTHEVLPSIRKTGSYGENAHAEVNIAEIVSQVMQELIPNISRMIVQAMAPVIQEMRQEMRKEMKEMKQLQIEHKKESLVPVQLDKIKIAVNRAATALADCHKFDWGRAVREVYTELNGRMGVFAYYHIAPSDFKDAIKLLERMKVVKEEEAKTGEPVRLNLEINIGVQK